MYTARPLREIANYTNGGIHLRRMHTAANPYRVEYIYSLHFSTSAYLTSKHAKLMLICFRCSRYDMIEKVFLT